MTLDGTNTWIVAEPDSTSPSSSIPGRSTTYTCGP